MDRNIINQCSVVLTRNCNLRCDFCYVKNAGYCADEMVSLDNLKKIVDFCCDAKVKYVFFTGGEPLLYPYINDILIYIKKKEHQIITAIATNGILLENLQFCKTLKDNGLDYLDISMKGRNSEEWVGVTGFDGYLRQQKAINNIASLQMDFTCSMVVTLENVDSLCDSVKMALDNGAKQFSFTFIIDNNKENDSTVAYLEKHNLFRLIEAFISKIETLNNITKEWWVEYSFPLCAYTEHQLEVLKGKLATPCQIHKKNAITFDTQLNLLPCDMYFNNKIGCLGRDFNTVEEYVKWQSNNLYKETIDNINHLPSEKCNECQYLDRCLGGCPVLWNNYSFEEMCAFMEKTI